MPVVPARPSRLPVTCDVRLIIRPRLNFPRRGNSPSSVFAVGARPRPRVTDRLRTISAEVGFPSKRLLASVQPTALTLQLFRVRGSGFSLSFVELRLSGLRQHVPRLSPPDTLQLTCSRRPPLTLVVNKMLRLFCLNLVGGSFAHFSTPRALCGDARVRTDPSLMLVPFFLGAWSPPLLRFVSEFGSGFYSNRPSTYPSLGSPTRYGDQTLVHRPFASPTTPRRSSRSANINLTLTFS